MKIAKALVIVAVAFAGLTAVVADGRHYDRRFARISYLEGNVVFRHESDTDWLAGSLNTPLQEQDRVYAPLNSRTEIEFDDGSFLRMAEDTEIRILSLAQNSIQIELAIGLVTTRFSSDIAFQIVSPAGTVHLLQKGVYRIEVPDDGSLDVAVRKGTAEVVRQNETLRVRRREALSVPLDANVRAGHRPIGREDGWDEWNDRRDASVVASTSRRYIPSDVYIGTHALDHHGSWVYVSGYGHCWRPSLVSYSWSPYRYGRWTYRPFWGWTWVSYEPWGWLPYHYGRWHYDPVFHWVWYPNSGFGLSFSFRYWSPGLVHFYRYGGGLHWFPYGPRDRHITNNYFYNVNNVTYNNHFQNTVNNFGTLPRDRSLENINVNGAIVSASERALADGSQIERRSISGRELATAGSPVNSLRDIHLTPSVKSRSPVPEVNVRSLGVTQIPQRGAAAETRERSIRPTVQTVLTGRDRGIEQGSVTRVERAEITSRDVKSAVSSRGVRVETTGGKRVISGERGVHNEVTRDEVTRDEVTRDRVMTSPGANRDVRSIQPNRPEVIRPSTTPRTIERGTSRGTTTPNPEMRESTTSERPAERSIPENRTRVVRPTTSTVRPEGRDVSAPERPAERAIPQNRVQVVRPTTSTVRPEGRDVSAPERPAERATPENKTRVVRPTTSTVPPQNRFYQPRSQTNRSVFGSSRDASPTFSRSPGVTVINPTRNTSPSVSSRSRSLSVPRVERSPGGSRSIGRPNMGSPSITRSPRVGSSPVRSMSRPAMGSPPSRGTPVPKRRPNPDQ